MSDEYEELMDAYKNEPTKRVAERILAVCQVLFDGISIAEVARRFRKVYNTIKNYCKRYKKSGIAGLRDAPRSGRPPKLKNETLDKYVGDTSKGIDLRTLSGELEENFGVSYTQSL